MVILREYSRSPAEFTVDCVNIQTRRLGPASRVRLEVAWSAETEAKAMRLRRTLQRKPLVEAAATALALILVHELTKLGQLDVTEYGDRADYRSIDDRCVLEVSGTENLDELPRRERQKLTQAISNPNAWDAYVVVSAFSARGHRIRFSRHTRREP